MQRNCIGCTKHVTTLHRVQHRQVPRLTSYGSGSENLTRCSTASPWLSAVEDDTVCSTTFPLPACSTALPALGGKESSLEPDSRQLRLPNTTTNTLALSLNHQSWNLTIIRAFLCDILPPNQYLRQAFWPNIVPSFGTGPPHIYKGFTKGKIQKIHYGP